MIFSMVILWWFNADLIGFTRFRMVQVKQIHEGETTHTCQRCIFFDPILASENFSNHEVVEVNNWGHLGPATWPDFFPHRLDDTSGC